MKIAFVAGLADKKLKQKLLPLLDLESVTEIHLYRRSSLEGIDRLKWMRIPKQVRNSKILGDLLRLSRLLLSGKRYDVIVGCNQVFHGVMAYLCGKLWSKPVVQVVTSEVSHVCRHPFLKHVLFAADACAVRGPVSKNYLQQLGYQGKIGILHNAFTIPDPFNRLNLSEKRYDILAVGDYAKVKSYPWMIRVLGGVKRKFVDIQAAIVGKGPFTRKLSALIRQCDLEGNVSLLGWRDEKELQQIYATSRILMQTSSSEGLPMSVIEAMSYKIPVFVTAVGELTWLVRDGRDGFVLPYGDTDKAVDTIVKGLSEKKKLEMTGLSAYNRIMELSPDFTPQAIADTWKQLLW